MANLVRRPTRVIEKLNLNMYDFKKESWHLQVLKVKEIQAISKGKGAVICFLDDGVGQNSEIYGKIRDSYKFLPIEEWEGEHSTFGATLAVGETMGLFPEMVVDTSMVLHPETGIGSVDWVVSAIYHAKSRGIKLINLSLGADEPDRRWEKALRDFCSDGQSIATIAAGNDSKQTDYPAMYARMIPGVISVAATQINPKGEINIATFSSWGEITISAPGHGLKSQNHVNELEFVSGTSFAAPIVGAAIAVAQTLRPGITQGQIIAALASTAKHMSEDKKHSGYGHIDIVSFLARVKDPKPITPMPLPSSVSRKRWYWPFG